MGRRWIVPPPDLAALLLAVTLGLWLRVPTVGVAVVAAVAGVCALVLAGEAARGGLRARRLAVLSAALFGLSGAGVAGVLSWRVRSVERSWPDVRERLIRTASLQLDETLAEAVNLARRLADQGALAAAQSQVVAFDLLARATDSPGPEAGVAVLDPDGSPWSWGGRHRLLPEPVSGELNARVTPFYVMLEARRAAGERVTVGHVVLAADGSVPDREQTVAARFARATGARLEFYAPGAAPPGTDVFDYCLPSCTPGPGNQQPDTLISVRTLPPAQGALKLELLATGGQVAAWAVTLCLLALLVSGAAPTRYLALGVLGLVHWLTPAGDRIGLSGLFSSATYYLDSLVPVTASAGGLLVAGVVASVLVMGLGAPRLHPRLSAVFGFVLLLLAPSLAWLLAQGIAPPAEGVGLGLWSGWEISIAVATAALVLLAAALLPTVSVRRAWVPWMAVLWGAGAAMIGLWVWQPGRGLPLWYTYLWVPAIAGVAWFGVPFRRVLAASAVAGSAAALLTWSAGVDGRVRLATTDMERLTSGRDPVALALLDRLRNELAASPVPQTAADLYRRWQQSALAQEGYPAVLATWGADGTLRARLELASLDLPGGLLQALARSAVARREPRLEQFNRVPGTHMVLATPLADGSVVTVGVGPRTRLIRPFRVARFLRRERELAAPYEMSLSEPAPGAEPAVSNRWWRQGQVVRAEGGLEVAPGVVRHLHVTVDLGNAGGLLVRGALLVLADVAVVVLLWLLGETLRGNVGFANRARATLRLRSYRSRLALALAVFFVVPTVGFAAWMAGRLRADVGRSRDLVIRQTLRDAGAAVSQGRAGAAAADPLGGIAEQVQTDLLLYQDGALRYSSAPLLSELGLVDVYLPPPVYRALILEDALEVMADRAIGGRRARVGFRAVSGPVRAQVLAAPRLTDERLQPSGESDLAFALLLVTVIGLGAAFALAGLAARSLAEPVGRLREAAAAVGRGQTPPPLGPEMPEEFVPVADAFARMAEDVRASQTALEAARQRTAAVLRNVATGVLALGGDLRINMANPRAEELLGVKLESGRLIREVTGVAWVPVWDWVAARVAAGDDLASEEFTLEGRRVRAQVSTLGADWGGCVVALDDITEIAHAVRVLAWGELARQVAHEIKNPLTPLRLGMQHLQRAYRGGRGDFEAALDRTARQILAEIDRLDAVARAFARFGAPPADAAGPLEAVDLVAVAREAAALYALGGDTSVELRTDGVITGRVRRDELKEVLVNLVENSRNARAASVTLAVREARGGRVAVLVSDDGLGIPPDDLPRIFEPHFSTTTSGTGLGLAICKRLVESWGGTITVASEMGKGTTVTLELEGALPSLPA
ncbi:MAG: ATP-binding protein [Gemmatimonadetes bacterium]|nr:ATP-binding protein [Gemmatimonadota bacterium]